MFVSFLLSSSPNANDPAFVISDRHWEITYKAVQSCYRHFRHKLALMDQMWYTSLLNHIGIFFGISGVRCALSDYIVPSLGRIIIQLSCQTFMDHVMLLCYRKAGTKGFVSCLEQVIMESSVWRSMITKRRLSCNCIHHASSLWMRVSKLHPVINLMCLP